MRWSWSGLSSSQVLALLDMKKRLVDIKIY